MEEGWEKLVKLFKQANRPSWMVGTWKIFRNIGESFQKVRIFSGGFRLARNFQVPLGFIFIGRGIPNWVPAHWWSLGLNLEERVPYSKNLGIGQVG